MVERGAGPSCPRGLSTSGRSRLGRRGAVPEDALAAGGEFGLGLALQRLAVEEGAAAGAVDHHLADEDVALEAGAVGGDAVAPEEIDPDRDDDRAGQDEAAAVPGAGLQAGRADPLALPP